MHDWTGCLFPVFLFHRFTAFPWVSFLCNIPWPFPIHYKACAGPIERNTHSSLLFHYGPSLYVTRTFCSYYGIITTITRGWNPSNVTWGVLHTFCNHFNKVSVNSQLVQGQCSCLVIAESIHACHFLNGHHSFSDCILLKDFLRAQEFSSQKRPKRILGH